MNITYNDAFRYVNNLRRKDKGHGLAWDSKGLHYFLVLAGNTKDSVNISDDEICNILEALGISENNIPEYKEKLVVELNVSATLISFKEYTRNGFDTHGKPGVYAVYGLEQGEEGVEVYVNENNTFQINIEIEIEIRTANRTIERGLFVSRRDTQYLGYKTVDVKSGVPGMELESVKYTLHSGREEYTYPIPEKILNDGGKFIVFCDRDDKIEVKRPDIDGITIRVTGE